MGVGEGGCFGRARAVAGVVGSLGPGQGGVGGEVHVLERGWRRLGELWGPEDSTPKPPPAKDFNPCTLLGGKPQGWLRRAFRSGLLPACSQVPLWPVVRGFLEEG